MINIAVLGSCVSRDSFNSQFIPNYKDLYQCCLHQNQMSIISLMAKTIPFNTNEIDNLKPFDTNHLKTELDKSFLDDMKLKQPDYLIIDLYGDIFYGVQEIEDSYITNKSWLFSKATLYNNFKKGESLSLQNDFDTFFAKWKQSVDEFFKYIKKELPTCKIILNQARFINRYKDENTNKIKHLNKNGKHRKINIKEYNKLWNTLDNYILENYKVYKLTYNFKEYISLENHPWGKFYVHYDKSFYRHFTTQLIDIILEDLKGKYNYFKRQKELVNSKSSTNITCNFKGKINKSTFNNPNYSAYRKNLETLGNPINDFKGESSTETYKTFSTINSNFNEVKSETPGTFPQRFFQFDIKRMYEYEFSDYAPENFSLININKIEISWWGKSNTELNFSIWNFKSNTWEKIIGNKNFKYELKKEKFTCKLNLKNNIRNYIDTNGKVNFIVSSNPATLGADSSLFTNYAELNFLYNNNWFAPFKRILP